MKHSVFFCLRCSFIVTALALGLVPRAALAANLPENGWLVWSSNRQDGRHEIYLKMVDEQEPTRLTTSGGNYPMWSPDGAWISYFNISDGWATIMRPDGSEQTRVCDSEKFDWTGSGQFWMYDGSGLVCEEGDSYILYNPASGQRSVLFDRSEVPALEGKEFGINSISRDGQWVAGVSTLFQYGYSAENGDFTAMYAAIFFRLDDKNKIYFLGQGCEPTFSPTEDRIYHVCSKDCENPTDIVQMELSDRMTRSSYEEVVSYPDDEWGHEYYPRISNDGKWLAYAAALAHAGNYNIYIHELGAGVKQREQVTDTEAVDNFPQLFIGLPHGMPCTSPELCPDLGTTARPDGASASATDAGPPVEGGAAQRPGGLDAVLGTRPKLGGGCALGPCTPARDFWPLLLLCGMIVAWRMQRRRRRGPS